jgi:hypothetical protein
MRNLLSSCFVFVTLFALNACAVGGNPQPYGRGYAAYEDEYKSAPGAEARYIGYEYNTQKNAAVIADMREAAADLVSKLDQNTSFSAQELFLTRPQASAFYNAFDYVLRDELTKRGYVIAQRPEGATKLHFAARYAENATAEKSAKQPLFLSLVLGGGTGAQSSHVSGVYTLPTYDFELSGTMAPGAAVKPAPSYPASAQRLLPDDA